MKPEFNAHEGLSALSCQAHLLAEALLCYADDEGYFNANPVLVKAGTCPLRKDFKNISKFLQELASVGYVRFGDFKGKRFGQIVNFKYHQKISHPAISKISQNNIIWENSPENSRDAPEKTGEAPENSGGTPEGLRPDQGTGIRDQGTGIREQGKEQGTGGADSGEAPESTSSPSFYSSPNSRFKSRGMVKRVHNTISDEAWMISTAVMEAIGAGSDYCKVEIARQAQLELKAAPDDMDGIRACMAGAWKEYHRCGAAGKISGRLCGKEKFYGEGRWRSPTMWGLKPGMKAYEGYDAA